MDRNVHSRSLLKVTEKIPGSKCIPEEESGFDTIERPKTNNRIFSPSDEKYHPSRQGVFKNHFMYKEIKDQQSSSFEEISPVKTF